MHCEICYGQMCVAGALSLVLAEVPSMLTLAKTTWHVCRRAKAPLTHSHTHTRRRPFSKEPVHLNTRKAPWQSANLLSFCVILSPLSCLCCRARNCRQSEHYKWSGPLMHFHIATLKYYPADIHETLARDNYTHIKSARLVSVKFSKRALWNCLERKKKQQFFLPSDDVVQLSIISCGPCHSESFKFC